MNKKLKEWFDAHPKEWHGCMICSHWNKYSYCYYAFTSKSETCDFFLRKEKDIPKERLWRFGKTKNKRKLALVRKQSLHELACK